jgi:acyl-CoA synthetase (AMP-forming)/AMP-acid ligase II
VAVLTLREGADLSLEDVKEFCRPRLSDYKIPHDIVLASIPRNASGKVLKHQLRTQVA